MPKWYAGHGHARLANRICEANLAITTIADAGAGHARLLARAAVGATSLGVGLALVGDSWPPADILAPLLVHLLAFGFVAAIALLAGRQQLATLLTGALLILGGHTALSHAHCCGEARGFSPDVVAPAPLLKVVTLNTWHDLADHAAIPRALDELDADIAVLTEFGPNKLSALEALRVRYPHQVSCAAAWNCSLVLLSRLPIEQSGFSSPTSGRPSLIFARVKIGRSLVTVVGTHVYRPSRDPWRHRAEMRGLAEFVRSIGGPVVVAGDFNASPWSASFQGLLRRTGLAPPRRLLPNWPARPLVTPQVALDHILVSGDLAIAEAGVGHAMGSDHLPVWALMRREPVAPGERGSDLAAAFLLGGKLTADLGGEHDAARNLRR